MRTAASRRRHPTAPLGSITTTEGILKDGVDNLLRKWWAQFVIEMFASNYDGQLYNSHRKIVPCMNRHIPGKMFEDGLDIGLSDMFYTDYKRGQLHRNYFNVETIDSLADRMAERINRRKAATLMEFVGNQQKGEQSLGYCIQGIALTNGAEGQVYLHMSYRTTEVIKKFGADLVFLTEDVWPRIKERLPKGTRLERVDFSFPSVSLSCMYLPTVFHLLVNSIPFMEALRSFDENLFYQSVRFIYIALAEGDRWKYKQRQICIKDFHTALEAKSFDRDELVNYCLQYFDPAGMPRRSRK